MERCDVLVAGAGPAGVAAAAEATSHGLDVVLVDPRRRAGGQYFARRDSRTALGGLPETLTAGLDEEHLDFWARSEVWGAFDESLAVTTSGVSRLVTPRAIVVATGATERAQPFPGWDRRSVLTAGAAQLLLKERGALLGGRIVVGGSGPFLVAVAAQLRRAGADVAALVEATPRHVLARRLAPLLASRALASDALRFARDVRRIPRVFGARIVRAEPRGVVLSTGREIACDVLCVGYGFEPRLALARLLGCAAGADGVVVDDGQRTSLRHVFAAGEVTGIGGATLAAVEGRIAALSAAADLLGVLPAAARERLHALRRRRARVRRAATRLLGAYVELDPLELADGDTVVCRCERVTLADVRAACRAEPRPEGTRALKGLLRCGMGPCQGILCERPLRAAIGVDELDAGTEPRVRPPIAPVRVGEVAALEELS